MNVMFYIIIVAIIMLVLGLRFVQYVDYILLATYRLRSDTSRAPFVAHGHFSQTVADCPNLVKSRHLSIDTILIKIIVISSTCNLSTPCPDYKIYLFCTITNSFNCFIIIIFLRNCTIHICTDTTKEHSAYRMNKLRPNKVPKINFLIVNTNSIPSATITFLNCIR